MNIQEAIQAVKLRFRVRRQAWNDKKFSLYTLTSEDICRLKIYGSPNASDANLSIGDILGMDWEIYKEQMTFDKIVIGQRFCIGEAYYTKIAPTKVGLALFNAIQEGCCEKRPIPVYVEESTIVHHVI